jgi:hypothetical protein
MKAWWIRFNRVEQTPDDINGFNAWLLGIIVIGAVLGVCWAWN